MTGEVDALVAGGLESISLVQNEHMNTYMAEDPWFLEHKPEIFMTMIATAEVVAGRYGVDRGRQDGFALRSQPRTAPPRRQAASMLRSCAFPPSVSWSTAIPGPRISSR
jgi:acetyl-CoA C-acetyltransferase